MNKLEPQFGSLASYLVSLLDCENRREALVLNGLSSEFVERYFKAADLRNLSNEEAVRDFIDPKFEAHYGFNLSNAQIGCAISHREVARSFLDGQDDLALVLEDDVVPTSENFGALVEDIASVFQEHARTGASFIVHLGIAPHWHKRVLHRKVLTNSSNRELPPLFLHSDPVIGFWYAHAYILSKTAAVRIVEREEKLISNVDDWLYRRKIGLIDQIFYTQPLVFKQNSTVESVIAADRQKARVNKTSREGEGQKHDRFNKSLPELHRALVHRISYAYHQMRSTIPYRLPVTKKL